MKILLIDDEYRKWQMLLETAKIGELIDSGPATTAEIALQIINNHPESDVILLDGYLESGNCLDIIPLLSPEQIKKIICFSKQPKDWKAALSTYGIRHFPGKRGDYAACIKGQCQCS